MIKTVSFNDILEIKIIDKDDCYSINAELYETESLHYQYLSQLIYVYINLKKNFSHYINFDLIKQNKHKYCKLIKEIIKKININENYSFLKNHLKITSENIYQLNELLILIEDL